ncbi:MAG TPA: hypothetical protein VGN46_12545 [Luteibacter sp.]|jgi:hypothetical protein|uniref:hypothetical protein n=1 Tax=Luteibacter sp. TaxID=1886636 RepID=UPI002F3EF4DA
MTTPWFLSHLGLDASAGEREVKRAYAQQLKAIDQATDPVAFDRLRQAYEVARGFVADNGQPTAPTALDTGNTPPAPRSEPQQAVDGHQPPVQEASHLDTPTTLGRRALDRFCYRVHGGDDADIARELAASLADLRLQHPGAKAVFEEGLIERLAVGGMRQRAAVFRVAMDQLGWNDLSHFRGLGAGGGAWIEAVERQRHTLSQSWDGPRLMVALEAIVRGSPMHDHLDTWHAANEALSRYPQLMALYLTPEQAAEWARQYTRRPRAEASAGPGHRIGWLPLAILTVMILGMIIRAFE